MSKLNAARLLALTDPDRPRRSTDVEYIEASGRRFWVVERKTIDQIAERQPLRAGLLREKHPEVVAVLTVRAGAPHPSGIYPSRSRVYSVWEYRFADRDEPVYDLRP